VIWKKKKDYNKLVKNLKLENRPFKQWVWTDQI
jgi:hypothetical protein